MKLTNVNWNTEKPTFEEVKGKLLVIESVNKANGTKYSDVNLLTTDILFESIFMEMVRYAVLSEGQTCEWKVTDNEGVCVSHTGHVNLDYFKLWKLCPNCGLPIHIVEDEQPLPYKGKLPLLREIMPSYWAIWWQSDDQKTYIKFCRETSKQEATRRWNAFLKGE